MNLQEKVDLTERLFNQSVNILSDVMKGEAIDKEAIKAAVTSMNNHVKLLNAKKGEEALSMAKKRFEFDWAVAISENKKELKKLVGSKKQ